MTKIPVGATIAATYRFTFGKFLDLLGVTWLPLGLVFAVGYYVGPTMLQISLAMQTQDFATVRRFLPALIPVYLGLPLLFVMLAAGVSQEVLGMRTRSSRVYFSLGKPIWRLIGAYLLAWLAFSIGVTGLSMIAAICLGLVALVAVIAGVGKGAIVTTFVAIFVITVYGAVIYAVVRLLFLLAPVTIAEERIGLRRAWSLGRGNFWRILLVFLGVFVPVTVIEFILFFVFTPHGLLNFPPPGASPEVRAAFARMWAAQMTAGQVRNREYWYLLAPLNMAFTTVFLGLGVGAQCFAYRALVPGGSKNESQ